MLEALSFIWRSRNINKKTTQHSSLNSGTVFSFVVVESVGLRTIVAENWHIYIDGDAYLQL